MPPSGCRFHPRCPHVMPRCTTDLPPRFDIDDAPGHWAACWLYGIEGTRDAGAHSDFELPPREVRS